MSQGSENETLRRRLVDWDPARHAPLDEAATRRMRLRIGARLREPATTRRRPAGWMIPVAVAATLLALVLGWRALTPNGTSSGTSPASPVPSASVAAETVAPPAGGVGEIDEVEATVQQPVGVPVAVTSAPEAARPASVRADVADIAVAEDSRGPRQPRQFQFQTSGGTRIFWTLDPDFSDEALAAGGE